MWNSVRRARAFGDWRLWLSVEFLLLETWVFIRVVQLLNWLRWIGRMTVLALLLIAIVGFFWYGYWWYLEQTRPRDYPAITTPR